MRLEFFVPGQARPAGSKGAFKHPHTGKIIVTHANPATKVWMDTVRFFGMKAANRMIPTREPIRLNLIFLRERPQSHYGSGRNAGVLKASSPRCFTRTPDLTKLTRAVEDALTGIIWKDDSQVIIQATMKRYNRDNEIPGVQIIIETVNGNTLKGTYDEHENKIQRQGNGSLFGHTGREGGDDSGNQPALCRLPQGQY